MELRARIAKEIRHQGPIPFSQYMELCLYDPELGYYSQTREQFGKSGDFYTSSDVHAVFGRLLARQFEEMWRALARPCRLDLIELGPGRGVFAQDVLSWTREKFPDLHRVLHYTFVERSPRLRERLRDRFAGQEGPPVTIVDSLEKLPAPVETAIVFANEFFDALPVEVIAPQGELRIALQEDESGEGFVETFVDPTHEELAFLGRYAIPPRNGRVEATLVALEYIRNATRLLKRGFLVAIDYGYTRPELLAGRPADTVRAFRQHALCNSPYEAPGEQDITANVNFTALREAGLAAGMEAGHILTQTQFLMGIGETNQFADAFEDDSPQARAQAALQLKHLVTPAGMGEIFQVLLMGRGVDGKKLAGLRYAR